MKGKIKNWKCCCMLKNVNHVLAKADNTSNLLSHWRHTMQLYTGLSVVQRSLRRRNDNTLQVFMNKISNQLSQAHWRRCKNMIENMAQYYQCYHLLFIVPIYTAEKLGFCHLLKKMDPQWDLPCLKSKIACVYNIKINAIKAQYSCS